MLLINELPALAVELRELLEKLGRDDLAAQIPALAIVDLCRCGDDFCASFYTLAKPAGAYGPNLETLLLDPKQGMLLLDVVNNRIAFVEVLYRDDIRKLLLAADHKRTDIS